LLSRLVSLIAAKAYFFCLDTKETKNQDNKDASTRPCCQGSTLFFFSFFPVSRTASGEIMQNDGGLV